MRLAKLICQLLDADQSSVCLLSPGKHKPLFRAWASRRKKGFIEKGCRLNHGVESKIIRQGQAILKGHLLGVPLLSEDVVGCVLVKRNKKRPAFEGFEQEILIAISEQSVTAIRNLQLYEEQQKIMLGSIKTLASLLDRKVPRAYTHSSGFSDLVVNLARNMHLSELDLSSLRYASVLHDAGKIDIPPEILTKSDKLTTQEYGIIKSHPAMGARIIRFAQSFKPIVPIILYHHEKYDGTGYPSGLKKGQIPLGARIMAVADAFEAMIVGRPYRGMVSVEEAIAEIKNNSGTQFDPKVVCALLDLVRRKKFRKYLRMLKK